MDASCDRGLCEEDTSDHKARSPERSAKLSGKREPAERLATVPTGFAGAQAERGRYLLTVTPESPAGQPGTSVALGLKLIAV